MIKIFSLMFKKILSREYAKLINFSWRRVWLIVAVFVVLVGIFLTGIFVYAHNYKEKVLPGVYLGGVHIGGMDKNELSAYLKNMNNKLLNEGIHFNFALENETKNKLREFLPAESSVENPIDLLGDARADRYKKALKIISSAPEIGSVICLLTPQEQTPVAEIAKEIIKFKDKTDKNIVTVFLGGEKVEKAITKLKQNEVCNFSFPDLAVTAIDSYSQWNEFGVVKTKTQTQLINEKRRAKVLEIIAKAKSENRQALYFGESAEVMAMYEINTVESFEIENYHGRNLGYPVVLKVDSDKVLHKTDKNGVILNIENEMNLSRAVSQIKTNFPESHLIIQPMAKKGAELIIGIKKDEIFGPVIVYGLGGIYAEFLKTVSLKELGLALRRSSPELKEHLLSQLSLRMREEVQEILQGPPQPKNIVEDAEKKVWLAMLPLLNSEQRNELSSLIEKEFVTLTTIK